jgi:hypothetical protein
MVSTLHPIPHNKQTKRKKNGACFISYESHLRMEKAKPLFSRISLLLVWLLDS